MTLASLVEAVGSTSPGSFSFSSTGPARASWNYYVGLSDLESAITDILGRVSATGSPDWKLRRSLPAAHPQWPWLYASAITSMTGLGASSTNQDAEPDLEAEPILSQYYPYPTWKLTVEFTPRPYAVLSDDNITQESITVYDDDGTATAMTSPYEYWRFTDIQVDGGGFEFATAQHGQMAFYTDAGSKPSGNTYPGHPRVLLPDSTLTLIWYQVPYSWVVHGSSKIFGYRGRVNQIPFYGFPAGSLLYDSFKLTRYVPPVAERASWFNTTAFTTDKICDVAFTLKHTSRTIGSAYTPINLSHIAAGHNLEPWIYDKKFYFVGNQNSKNTSRVPKFLSAPFQLMFKDPGSF